MLSRKLHKPSYIILIICIAAVSGIAGCITEKSPGEENIVSVLVHKEGDAFQFHNLKVVVNENALAATVSITIERMVKTAVSAGGLEIAPVSSAYSISPETTRIEGYYTLTIYFPPAVTFTETELKQLYLCRLDGSTLAETLPTSVNRTGRAATCHVSRLGTYLLARIPSEQREPVEPPGEIKGTVPPAGHQVIVSWEPRPAADRNTSYRVYRGSRSGEYSHLGEAGSNLFYLIDELYNDQPVYIVVSAVQDEKRESLFSDEISITPTFTFGYQTPTPSRLFEPGSVTDTTLRLRWSKCYDQSFREYRIFRSRDSHVSTDETPTCTISEADTVSFDDSGLIAGTTYYYRLVVKNSLGFTAESMAVAAETEAMNQPPEPVWQEAPSGITSSAVKLSWISNIESDFSHYRLFRSESSPVDVNDTMVQEITGRDSVSWYDLTLNAGTTYYYRVFTYDSQGLYTGSNTRMLISSESNYAPPAPVLVASRSVPHQVSLAWTPCPDADFSTYTIERDTGDESWATTVTVMPATDSLTYWDIGLDTTIPFSYRIKVTDQLGLFTYSNEVTVAP